MVLSKIRFIFADKLTNTLQNMSKNRGEVALVLSSGSSRGLAHIGAIRALEEYGYHIHSISGCSMGALIGGMYAAGRLDEMVDWLHTEGLRGLIRLIDATPKRNAILKGNLILQFLYEHIPTIKIEELMIPTSIVATDIVSAREVVFTKGDLVTAIRASISLPAVFEPVRIGDKVLVDGGLTNPLPINRVSRKEGDILVAVNVSAPEEPGYVNQKGINILQMLTRTINIMIQSHSQLEILHYQPDILVQMPMNYCGRFAFTEADRIIDYGEEHMRREIEAYRMGSY